MNHPAIVRPSLARQNAKFEPSPTAEFTEPVVEGFHRITDKPIRGTSVALSQEGEFAFIILALGVSSALMGGRIADMLIVVVTLSMATTLLAFRAGDRMNVRLGPKAEPAYEQYIDEENRVIIAGFGRIG